MHRLALLVVAVVLAVATWLLWPTPPRLELARRDRANEAETAPAAPASADAANSATPLESAQRTPEATAEAGETTGVRVTGRVLDDHRRPAPGAMVTLFQSGAPPRTTTSDASGAFAILIERPTVDPASPWYELGANQVILVATAPPHQVARAIAWLGTGPWETPRPVVETAKDVGSLVMVESAIVRLFVHDADGPVADARVFERDKWSSLELPHGRTGADGRLEIVDLVPGLIDLHVDGGERGSGARAFRGDSGRTIELHVQLQPRRAVDFEVVDVDDGAPVGGAKLLFFEPYLDADMSGGFSSSSPAHGEQQRADLTATCDASGRAHVLLDTFRPLNVWTIADGWLPPRATNPGALRSLDRAVIDGSATAIRLQLEKASSRRVRWPVRDGEVPAPPDGTPLTMRSTEFLRVTDRPAGTARIADHAVEIDDVPRSGWNGIVVTPDGALARLWVDETSETGDEVAFVAGRTARVTILHADGTPSGGRLVQLRDQGNNAAAPAAWSDAAGSVRFEALVPQIADVYVGETDASYADRRVGTLDLKKGDAAIECRIGDGARGRLRLLVDGAPRLPASYRLWDVRSTAKVVHEEPELGEVTFELGASTVSEGSVGISAPGFLSARVDVAMATVGEPVASEVTLQRAARVTAHVRPVPRRGSSVVLERPDDPASTDRSKIGYEATLREPNGPEDSFEWFPVAAGRWRVRESRSGIASEEFDLAPGDLRDVELDLTRAVALSGIVELPSGVASNHVRILLAGEPLPEVNPDWDWLEIRGATRTVNADGTFQIAVAPSDELVLRAWHPWLQPAREGGVVKVTDPSQPVTLKLEPRGLLTFRANLPSRRGRNPMSTLAVWLLGADGAAPRRLAAIAESSNEDTALARCAVDVSGRFDLLIDGRNNLAPARLDGVELSAEDVVDLGEIEFPAGVELRVPITMRGRGSPPRIYVSATTTDAPRLMRWTNSRGEAEATLKGLGPGRWDIQIGVVMDGRTLKTTTIDVDGVNDAIVPLEIE